MRSTIASTIKHNTFSSTDSLMCRQKFIRENEDDHVMTYAEVEALFEKFVSLFPMNQRFMLVSAVSSRSVYVTYFYNEQCSYEKMVAWSAIAMLAQEYGYNEIPYIY